MKSYKIIQYENNKEIEAQEFTESEFLLLQSLVEDGEEYYSQEDLDQTVDEDIPIQECYAEMYSKLDKVLGITNFPNEEYDPELEGEE
jgi:hypothetical protein